MFFLYEDSAAVLNVAFPFADVDDVDETPIDVLAQPAGDAELRELLE